MEKKLPPNVINLINQYSKPLTHPYWRFGTRHARIFKECGLMNYLRGLLNKKIINEPEEIHLNFDKKLIFNYDYTFNEIIQNYGEEIFNLFTTNNTNFYTCIRWYQLKHTGKFIFTEKIHNDNSLYEWIYKIED